MSKRPGILNSVKRKAQDNGGGENNDAGIMLHTLKEFESISISKSLSDNIKLINEIFGGNTDFVVREVKLGRTAAISAAVLYLDSMIDSSHMDNNIIGPLTLDAYASGLKTGDELLRQLNAGNLVTRAEMKACSDFGTLMSGLLEGESAILVNGADDAYIASAKGYETRTISESTIEPSVRGSREAFVESLSTNISMVRKRIHSHGLTFEMIKLGRVTQTKVCITYIKGICSAGLVNEVRSRLGRIDIDGILESGYIEELIQDSPYSPFPQLRNTERPDAVSASLLDGRVAIFTDNTPTVLIAPGEFFSLMQSPEDYYNRYIFSSFIRFFRYFSIIIALILPAAYIAITTYHSEMIPTELLISIMAARTGVPLPLFLEVTVMVVTFEVLREAGLRLPKMFGQAVSIVGALVIGQSAVQAAIVSPLTVIVVALTGIASFTIPQYNITMPIRILRFALMILAAIFGLIGVMTGVLVILLHMSALRSFGVPYLSPLSPSGPGLGRDLLFRAPWWRMFRRPSQITGNSTRESYGQKPVQPDGRSGDI